MKFITKFALTSILCVLLSPVFAETKQQNYKIILESIMQKTPTRDVFTDKVYASIIKYPQNQRPVMVRVPEFPTYWLANQLGEVKDITLYEDSIGLEESYYLIISFVEQDLEPWNADDLIGTIRLNLKNIAEKLENSWEVPVFEDIDERKYVKIVSPLQDNIRTIEVDMHGHGGHYTVRLKLTTDK